MVVSAMKMEAVVTAPCAGTVVRVLALQPGDAVVQDQLVAVVRPGEVTGERAGPRSRRDLAARARRRGHAAGHRRRPAGAGLRRPGRRAPARPGQADLPRAHRPAARRGLVPRGRQPRRVHELRRRRGGSSPSRRPTTSAGRARSRGVRRSSAPTTSPRAAGTPTGPSARRRSTSTSCRCSCRCRRSACSTGRPAAAASRRWCPSSGPPVSRTAEESSGAIEAGKPRVSGGGGSFLVGHLGVEEYARQLATVPVVNVLLGSVVGIGAAKAVLGHFSVMVRDIAQLFVAGPPVVSHAMGYDITKEDLGGWQVHCRNGSVDNLAETEEDALAMTRRFLSYLPSSVHEAPPVLAPAPDDPTDRREDELLTLIPRPRTSTFDIRRAITLMADRDSWFEIGPLWGTDQIAGFARFDGHPVGVIASDSRHLNGGAMTADGCDKLTRHLDLCDLFHLPGAQPGRQPGLRRRPRARDQRHDPQGGDVDGRLRPGAGADLHRADAAQLRRRRQLHGHAPPPAGRPGDVAGGRRRRHPARGWHRGRLQAPAGRGGRPGRPAGRAGGPHRERPRPDRPAQPVPAGGADRPPRHPPARSASGSRRRPGWPRPRPGWCPAPSAIAPDPSRPEVPVWDTGRRMGRTTTPRTTAHRRDGAGVGLGGVLEQPRGQPQRSGGRRRRPRRRPRRASSVAASTGSSRTRRPPRAVAFGSTTTSTSTTTTTTAPASLTVTGRAVAGTAGGVETVEPFAQTDPFAEVVRLADGTCVGWSGSRGGSTVGLAVGTPVTLLETETNTEVGTGHDHGQPVGGRLGGRRSVQLLVRLLRHPHRTPSRVPDQGRRPGPVAGPARLRRCRAPSPRR